jgi:predicted Zn-dependent protease
LRRAYHLDVVDTYFRRLAAFTVAVLALALGGRALPAGLDSKANLEHQIENEIAAGRLHQALTLARQAVSQYPASSGLYRLLGTLELKIGQSGSARADLRHSIELDPTFPEAYYELGSADFGAGDFRDAARLLNAYLRLNSLNAHARLLLGRAYYNLNQMQAAKNQLQRVLQSAPQEPMIHYYLALVEKREGNAAGALAQLQQEIRTHPRFYPPYLLAGDLDLKAGDARGAEQILLRGTALSPGDDRARVGLGRAFLMERQPARAAAELKLALKENPQAADAHCVLGQAYEKMGAIEDAQLEFHACALMGSRKAAPPAAGD